MNAPQVPWWWHLLGMVVAAAVGLLLTGMLYVALHVGLHW